MRTVFFLASVAVTLSSSQKQLHVCCGCGDDSAVGTTRATPLNSLGGAQDRLAALRAAAIGDLGISTVFMSGTCAPQRVFGPFDGGIDEASHVTYQGYPGEAPAVVTGGAPVAASALQPVTGPAYIIEQINATALPFIRHGLWNAAVPSVHGRRGIDLAREPCVGGA
jgi:hypothetical protein